MLSFLVTCLDVERLFCIYLICRRLCDSSHVLMRLHSFVLGISLMSFKYLFITWFCNGS